MPRCQDLPSKAFGSLRQATRIFAVALWGGGRLWGWPCVCLTPAVDIAATGSASADVTGGVDRQTSPREITAKAGRRTASLVFGSLL